MVMIMDIKLEYIKPFYTNRYFYIEYNNTRDILQKYIKTGNPLLRIDGDMF